MFSTAPLPPSHTLRSPSNQLSKAQRNDTAHDLHAPRMHAYTPLTTITRNPTSKNITNCQRTFQRERKNPSTIQNTPSIPPRRKDLDTPCRFQPQEDRQTKGKEERGFGTSGKRRLVFLLIINCFFAFVYISCAYFSASLLHTLSIHSHTFFCTEENVSKEGERGNGMTRHGS